MARITLAVPSGRRANSVDDDRLFNESTFDKTLLAKTISISISISIPIPTSTSVSNIKFLLNFQSNLSVIDTAIAIALAEPIPQMDCTGNENNSFEATSSSTDLSNSCLNSTIGIRA